MRGLFVTIFLFSVLAAPSFVAADQFSDYWYSGKAEITSYELSQARYGNENPGYAVLIFVTEDFSRSKHIKLDNPSRAGKDAVKILKLNFVKKFNTGIYRYSTMSSVFAPVSGKDRRPLKVTLSSQEWCGNVFMQLNRSRRGYDGKFFSYFEDEGDGTFKVRDAFLEDEIWTLVRMNPESLPTGRIRIFPRLLITRFLHTGFGVEEADAKISNPSETITRYSLFFPKSERVFEMDFETVFPHKIVSWREIYKSGWGPAAKKIETRAQAKKTIISDYWNKNSPPDEKMRRQLGIAP